MEKKNFQFSDYFLDCRQYIPSPRARGLFSMEFVIERKRSSNKRFRKPTGLLCMQTLVLPHNKVNSDDDVIVYNKICAKSITYFPPC